MDANIRGATELKEQIDKIKIALVNCMAGEPSIKEIREAIEALNEIENINVAGKHPRLEDELSTMFE